jgi:hypothetical protein
MSILWSLLQKTPRKLWACDACGAWVKFRQDPPYICPFCEGAMYEVGKTTL